MLSPTWHDAIHRVRLKLLATSMSVQLILKWNRERRKESAYRGSTNNGNGSRFVHTVDLQFVLLSHNVAFTVVGLMKRSWKKTLLNVLYTKRYNQSRRYATAQLWFMTSEQCAFAPGVWNVKPTKWHLVLCKLSVLSAREFTWFWEKCPLRMWPAPGGFVITGFTVHWCLNQTSPSCLLSHTSSKKKSLVKAVKQKPL